MYPPSVSIGDCSLIASITWIHGKFVIYVSFKLISPLFNIIGQLNITCSLHNFVAHLL